MGLKTKRFYVYAHIRLDTNTIFYIGKGTRDRAYSKKYRNKYWKNIVNSCDYEIRFIKTELDEKAAYSLEYALIKFYKTLDQCEANLATGGGLSGLVPWNRGKPLSAETRAKISAANKGKIHTAKAKAKMSKARKGKKLSKNHCKRISEGKLGVQLKEPHKLNISKGKLGTKYPKQSKEHIEKRLTYKRKPIVDNFGNIYRSTADAALVLDIGRTSINNNLKGLSKLVANKYTFKYLEEGKNA